MAEPGAVASLEEDLTCPICLGIYNNPVSLSCGHSFCKGCIREARSCRESPLSCPLCGTQADSAMEPQPNIQLRSIVQKLLGAPAHQEKEKCDVQSEEEEEEGSVGQRDAVILCDFCLQEPQPAVKTCLSCEASLCQAHLSKHSTKSPLRHHVLMDPCDNQVLAERRCPQHNKLLECYCQTDAVCICVLCCVISSHKKHKIISLEEAFGQAQSDFLTTLEAVKTHEAALNQSIANLLKQEAEVKTKESLRRNRLESLFEEMCLQIDNDKREVLKMLNHGMEQQLSEIQAEIQKQKEKKDVASRDIQELEALRNQKDQLLFTKAFAAIQDRKHKLVPSKDSVELPKPPILLDELTTHATLRLFRQFLSDMQSLFKAPPVHEHLTVPTADGCGHTDTIRASNSRSFASLYNVSNPYVALYVKSNQAFSEGCHFWEVDTSNSRCWRLGTVCSNLECYLEKLCNPCHCLCVFLGQVMITKKDSPPDLKVVRLELDCGRNTLTFYNMSVKDGDPAESLSLIEAVTIPSNYPLHASFTVSDGFLKLL